MSARLPGRGTAVLAHFIFHGSLNDFLPHRPPEAPLAYTFEPHQTVKHLAESLGVPHPEIGQILVNGRAVDFSARLHDNDLVEVYPAVPELAPPGEARFVLDNHLGRLAAYLRMLGFDTLYRNDYHDQELAEVADQQGRILLTRDRRLLMRKTITRGYCIRRDEPRQQALEVVQHFNLVGQVAPFRRCLRCNHPLQPVSKQAILHRLQPLTRLYYDDFHLCPACDQVYWKGSHYERMAQTIASFASPPPQS